jgi:hypothetical protein
LGQAIPRSPWAEGLLDLLARVVNAPTIADECDVLLAVVAWPAAHGRGAGAKVTTAASDAVAWRMSFGTQTVGFLKLAIFGLRAIEHPACAVALTTEMIAVHASCPYVRTALTHARRSDGCNPYTKWKKHKLLPALRTRLEEESHAASAWIPGRNINARVLSVARSRVQMSAFGGYCPPGLSAHLQHR